MQESKFDTSAHDFVPSLGIAAEDTSSGNDASTTARNSGGKSRLARDAGTRVSAALQPLSSWPTVVGKIAMAASVTVTCWVKADTESKHYEVSVPATIMKANLDGLRKVLGQANPLREVLQRCYPSGNWQIFDRKFQRLTAIPQVPAAGASSAGVTVILGTESEGLKQTMRMSVKHMPHHKVMTNSEAHFTNEHGKRPARLLFCEFIDNSIEAFCRAAGGAHGASHAPNPKASSSSSTSGTRPLIEVHLVYKTGQFDYSRKSDKYLQVCARRDTSPR